MSPLKQHQLACIVDTMLLVHRQEQLLDAHALRYLAAMHLGLADKPGIESQRSLLDYKAFLWAFHSRDQERLVLTLESLHQGNINWPTAQRYGVFLWLRSQDHVRAMAENVARQQFAGQDERDPTSCSLLYYALGKEKLVWGLWKQAFWHPDQRKMLAFLSNDFSQQRWKSAALKNAFALLSQRRFGEQTIA